MEADFKMPSRIDTGDVEGGGVFIAKLGQAQFDPVDFLNDTLPNLNLSSQPQTLKGSRATYIQSTSNEALDVLSSLNTVNIRSTSELTTLTDEIIRSGNRLAYEVEVLRGDINGFHEVLTETLRNDIAQFVRDEAVDAEQTLLGTDGDELARSPVPKDEPEFMSRLRLLGKVKARLESVITVFGEAMKWPVPPSEVSGAALISVSAPELGIQSTKEDDKTREVLMHVRAEINDLIGTDAVGYAGLEAASRRVQHYRQLAMLWKGTGEEKARLKFVESLTRLVDDRKKMIDAHEAARNNRSDSSDRFGSGTGRNLKGANEAGGAAGLFRRLKDDLYFE